MRKEEQQRLIKLLLKRLDSGENVDAGVIYKNPTASYCSEELARQEWEAFFRHYPQVIGLSGDLPQPGSFLTVQDFGVPVLATRGQDGQFRAFVNSCRHRGVVLTQEPRGRKDRFACPFHGWTYSGEGELLAVPMEQHFGHVDKSCHGLVCLPCAEHQGLLWVHPDPDGALDVPELLGGLEDFATWGLGDLVNFGDRTYHNRMNWKLGIDTFGETYHFPVLHRDTLASDLYGNVQTYDIFGRNHRMGLCRRDIDLLRQRPPEQWNIALAALSIYYLFPNIQVNVLPSSVVLVRIYPDPASPSRAISRVSFYASQQVLDDETLQVRSAINNFADVVRDEDFAVAERSQLGAEAGTPEYLIFGRNEPALHHYHNTYRKVLGLPQMERLA